MIRTFGQCPYCPTRIAYDWVKRALVFDPDTRLPICDHVVSIGGAHSFGPDQALSAEISWTNAKFNALASEPRLRRYLAEIQLEAISDFPEWEREYDLGVVWTTDVPELESLSGLDLAVIYALDPGAFLTGCLSNIESFRAPYEPGPIDGRSRNVRRA